MAIKERISMWIKEKQNIVHSPCIYWMTAMITNLLGIIISIPIRLRF